MAQALDALERPKLVLDIENYMDNTLTRLSRCEIEIDHAVKTIIEYSWSRVDENSVPGAVAKFFFPRNFYVSYHSSALISLSRRRRKYASSLYLTSRAHGLDSGCAFSFNIRIRFAVFFYLRDFVSSFVSPLGGARVLSNSPPLLRSPEVLPLLLPKVPNAQLLTTILQAEQEEWHRFCERLDQEPGVARASLSTVIEAVSVFHACNIQCRAQTCSQGRNKQAIGHRLTFGRKSQGSARLVQPPTIRCTIGRLSDSSPHAQVGP